MKNDSSRHRFDYWTVMIWTATVIILLSQIALFFAPAVKP